MRLWRCWEGGCWARRAGLCKVGGPARGADALVCRRVGGKGQGVCARMCLGEVQGSGLPARGKVGVSRFPGNRENGRRRGCLHVCTSGEWKGCPQKGACAFFAYGRCVEGLALHTWI